MADVVGSLLVSDLLFKLKSPAVRKFKLLRGLEDDVSALRATLEQIQAVLQDAEVKQRKQKAVETWLKNLKSVALEVENVLDEVSTEALLRRLRFQRGIIYRVRAFFSSKRNKLIVRNRIAQEVKNIRNKLDAIENMYQEFDDDELLETGMISLNFQDQIEEQFVLITC